MPSNCVTHRRLDKPKYATLDAREEAEALDNRTLAALERGDLPGVEEEIGF
jgi:hypothetical protein